MFIGELMHASMPANVHVNVCVLFISRLLNEAALFFIPRPDIHLLSITTSYHTLLLGLLEVGNINNGDTNRQADNLVVGLVLAEVGAGRAIGILSQAVAIVVVDQVATLVVGPGIGVAARVAGQDVAVGIDDALIRAEQAANVAVVTVDPDLSVGGVAGLPANGTGLVISQALEGEGVEDLASGGNDGVVGAAHAARDSEDGSAVTGHSLGRNTGGADLDLGGGTGPEILDVELGVGVDAGSADTETSPRDSDVGGGLALVKNGEKTVTVGKALAQNIPGGVLADKSGLLDKRVLVNSNEVLVGEEGNLLGAELGNISTDDERGREGSPESKVRLLFVHGVAAVVGVEEVGVVEVARLLVASKADVLAVVDHHTVPSIGTVAVAVDKNVVRVAGQLTVVCGPVHHSVPVGQVRSAREVGRRRVREDDGLGEVGEQLEPLGVDLVVSSLLVRGDVAAGTYKVSKCRILRMKENLPIKLEVLETPVGEGLEVKLLETKSAGVATARQGARITVDSGNEALGLDVLGEPRKTLGELGSVPDHLVVGGITLHVGPAVIEVEAVVASSQETVLGHGVGSIDKDLLVDVTHVTSPVVEAHGRQGLSLGVGRRAIGSAEEARGRGEDVLRLHCVRMEE